VATVTKYAVYAGRVEKAASGNIFVTPLDNVDSGYYPDVTVYDFGQGAGLPMSAGDNVDVGFGMKVLKDGSKLPHNLICLQIDDGAAGYTPAPGLSNNAIEDAIAMGLAAHGGYELTPANALLLVQELFPAVTVEAPDGSTYAYGAPYLDGDVIKRDCNYTPAS